MVGFSPRWCVGWCGECYENASGRGNHRGHGGYAVRSYLSTGGLHMALRRRDVSAVAGNATAQVEGGKFAARYPLLWEFLSVGTFDDGSSRKLGTVTLFVDDSGVKACLNDREQGLTAFVSAPSLEALLDAVEAGFHADQLDWRRPTQPKRRK